LRGEVEHRAVVGGGRLRVAHEPALPGDVEQRAELVPRAPDGPGERELLLERLDGPLVAAAEAVGVAEPLQRDALPDAVTEHAGQLQTALKLVVDVVLALEADEPEADERLRLRRVVAGTRRDREDLGEAGAGGLVPPAEPVHVP